MANDRELLAPAHRRQRGEWWHATRLDPVARAADHALAGIEARAGAAAGAVLGAHHV